MDGENCILAPPGDIGSWKKALEVVRDNPVFWEKISRNARRDYLANYTWEARARKVMTWASSRLAENDKLAHDQAG